MSEEARKNCRTQGKYGNKNYHNDDKRSYKNRGSKQKVSLQVKETQEKKFPKRESGGNIGTSSSFNSESESPIQYQDVRYQENSDHSFAELDEPKKPIEIIAQGKHILSVTENGESSVLFYPHFYEDDKAADLFEKIYWATDWDEKDIVIHGVEYPQPRLVTWYGPFPYSYSGTTLEPAEMPDYIKTIKEDVEEYLKKNGIDVKLNSVLLNLYRDNKDSVAWHSDDELTMGVSPTIASVSLGETRKFEMRRKPSKPYENKSSDGNEDEYFVRLKNGSLIIMDGCMQEDWQHRIPKEYHDRYERINLTFRTVFKLENSPRCYDPKPNLQPIEREITQKSDQNNIKFDERDFPPLKFDSSRAYSYASKHSQDTTQDFKSSVSSNDNFNRSYKSKKNFPSIKETSLNTSDEMNLSEEEWVIKTPSCNNTPTKINIINESEEEWVIKTPNCKASARISENFSRSVEEQPLNTSKYKALNINNNFFESEKEQNNNISEYKAPSRINDNLNRSKKGWFDRSPEYNLSEKNNDNFCDAEEECTVDPIGVLNNLNENKESSKIKFHNKNLQTYNCSSEGDKINADVFKLDKDLSIKQRPSFSSINKHEYACEVTNKLRINREDRWEPNLEAEEFVPVVNTVLGENHYMKLTLCDLLDYNIEVMPFKTLMNYAFAIKNKVLEDLGEFKIRDKDDLLTYCNITDGTQTEKNQKLITSRICSIVKGSLFHNKEWHNQRHHKTFRSQNHYGYKRNQDRGRASYHR